MIVKETSDLIEIKRILCDPVIYDTITGDDNPKAEEFEPPISEDYQYVGGYVGGEIVALMVYHAFRDGNECHAQVLPEFRKEYAREFGEKAFMFRGKLPLYARIPDNYPNVLNAALSFGFKVIDRVIGDHIKHSITYDTSVLRFQ